MLGTVTPVRRPVRGPAFDAGHLLDPRLDRSGAPLPRLLRFRTMAAVAVVLSALSLLLFRTPTFDVWAWLLWGREAASLHLSTTWGPSFKPLPVAVTTLAAPLGDAAPLVWLLVARVGGLLAVGAAARLAYRLSGPVAALLAALGLLGVAQYVGYLLPQGMSEPLMVAFTLWGVDRLLVGRRESAFWLGVLAGLLRPEIWPFLLGYAVLLAVRPHGIRAWRIRARWLHVRLAAGLVLLPLAWYVPDYLGSGQPFRQGAGATVPGGPLTQASPALAVLRQVRYDVPRVVLVGAVLGLVAAVLLRRGAVVALAAFGAAWISVVALLTEADQNSGLSRYVLPTYAVLAVLGGIGWAEVGREIVRRLSSSRGSGRRYPVLLAGAAVAVVGLLALDSATSWLREISVEAGELRYQAGLQHSLAPAIAAAGGAEEVRSCGQVWTSTYQVPFVAWTLNERIRDVWSQQGPGLPESAYVGPLLQTRDRRDAPIAPVPFDFLAYRTAGTAESAGATWTIQLPADCG